MGPHSMPFRGLSRSNGVPTLLDRACIAPIHANRHSPAPAGPRLSPTDTRPAYARTRNEHRPIRARNARSSRFPARFAAAGHPSGWTLPPAIASRPSDFRSHGAPTVGGSYASIYPSRPVFRSRVRLRHRGARLKSKKNLRRASLILRFTAISAGIDEGPRCRPPGERLP